ncbi:MAG: N-acetyltransferase [Planctomycetaceae bacterium]|nr:N-acetyltransferase [Planctomycetaceae bacterium]
MTTHYYKRFRMECDLTAGTIAVPALPGGYRFVPWQVGQEDRHAWVKFQSFRDEVDSSVFECLGDYQGCLRLMREIARQDGFIPEATWLVAHAEPGSKQAEECGTIQGVALTEHLGSIQNLGITPAHRGLGVGRILVLQALVGFQQAGLHRVCLEVTANNAAAVELYRSVGFRATRTMYRSVEYDAIGV